MEKIEEQFIYQQARNQGGEAALEKFSPLETELDIV